jgi:hypothetical protein
MGNKTSGHRDTVDLPLALFGIALFSSKEAHRLVIVDVLWAVYDGNHFALGTNGLTGTSVLDNFFEVAFRRIPITPDFNPNLVIRHQTSFLSVWAVFSASPQMSSCSY